jgi:methionine-rich copper-binding protein CopC
MVRSTFLLLLGLAFTVQEANAAALANPSAFFPADATDNQPLKDFSFLLTFAEAVQYASSSVTTSITVRKAATDQGHVVRCNSPSMEVVSKYAVVPVTTEIQTASKQIVQVPSNCFRNSGFESISANYVAFDFTTITKGASSILTNDKISPGFMTAASNPSQPADQAWVTTSQDFTLYFSEMVQAGTGSWTVTAQSGTGTASFQTADMTTSAGKAMVDWTLQAIPISFHFISYAAGGLHTFAIQGRHSLIVRGVEEYPTMSADVHSLLCPPGAGARGKVARRFPPRAPASKDRE